MKRPHCGCTDWQYKVGTNPSGSQPYLCDWCHRTYTPQPHSQGYAEEVRQHALRLYVDGINLRRIGHMLGSRIKACPTGWPPLPVSYLTYRQLWCHRRPCMNSTRCTPLSRQKKPRLRHYPSRPRHPLYRQLVGRD